MQYYIMKSGLEIFDLCRAYGLATFIDFASAEDTSPIIYDAGSFYIIEHESIEISKERLIKNVGWHSLFEESPDERTWSRVFLTDKKNWPKKVKRVKEILTKNAEDILRDYREPYRYPQISSNKGETLSGPLDPSAFKGLRGKTRGDYTEKQTRVDDLNWAIASLGGKIGGKYLWDRRTKGYFAIFPAPKRVESKNWREISNWLDDKCRLNYISVQNAAAHFSVLLAEKMREMSASKSQFRDTFSGLLYFSIVQSGQQFKPSVGGNLSLHPLMTLALPGNPAVAKVFDVWNYLFRKGSVQGCEDLAEAITQFIMSPSLEAYENHVKVFLRYVSMPREVKSANLYDDEALKEVIRYVT